MIFMFGPDSVPGVSLDIIRQEVNPTNEYRANTLARSGLFAQWTESLGKLIFAQGEVWILLEQ